MTLRTANVLRRTVAALLLAIPAAAQSTPAVDRKQEIRDLFDLLDAAVRRKDRASIERLYAPEFVFAFGTSGVLSRKEQIDALLQRQADKSQLAATPLDGLRFYGDVAQLRIQTPTMFSVTTFVKRSGRWQISLTQTNLLPTKKN